MGVLLAIPMKRQMINHEQLPFPSGIAAATTLRSLYSEGVDAVRQAYALVAALFAGAVIGVLNTGEGTLPLLDRFFAWMRTNLFNVQLPEQVPANGFMLVGNKPMVGAGLESSGLLIAAGMIVGLRVSVSMLVSSSLLYFVITPWLIGIDAAHAGDASWVVSIPLVGGGMFYHPPRWGLWGGTAVMVFASLTSLALQWKTVVAFVHAVPPRRRPERRRRPISPPGWPRSRCPRRGSSPASCRSRSRWCCCRWSRSRSTGGPV